MEDNLQTIIVVIISVFLLFIFPVYMAYEKKDDISYALAMRYTQDLVDEVRNKGYITRYMYEDYRAKLKVTGNSYDIKMKHEYKRYDPITKYYNYSEQDKKYILVKTTTQEEKEKWYKDIEKMGIDNGKLTNISSKENINTYILDYLEKEYKINKVEDTYEMSTQVYNENHIVNTLYSEKKLKLNSNQDTVLCDDKKQDNGCEYAYTMNVNDNFNVTIKNTNITLATVIYNMVTANVMNENTRIYVNYGGTILSSKWYGDIDYSKLEPTVSLDNLKYIDDEELLAERIFTTDLKPIERINTNYEGEYKIEFDVKPGAVTELKEKGEVNVVNTNYNNFNFVLGNSVSKNTTPMLSVAVGYNGILLMTNNAKVLKTKASEPEAIGTYNVNVQVPVGTYIDETTGETVTQYKTEIEQRYREITDYTRVVIARDTTGRLKASFTGKSGVSNYEADINISDPDNIFSALNDSITIDNPKAQKYSFPVGTTSTRGTNATCDVIFTENTISISANKTISQETVILSYPMDIKEYTHMGIEIKKKDNGKYIAKLFVQGEKVEESVEMDVVPKIDSIGGTYIGTLQKFFIGSIKNIKLYN